MDWLKWFPNDRKRRVEGRSTGRLKRSLNESWVREGGSSTGWLKAIPLKESIWSEGGRDRIGWWNSESK